MPATRDPPGIHADVHAQHVARVPAERAGQRPVVCAEDVDVLVEPAADEERARFLRPRFEAAGGVGFDLFFVSRRAAVAVGGWNG